MHLNSNVVRGASKLYNSIENILKNYLLCALFICLDHITLSPTLTKCISRSLFNLNMFHFLDNVLNTFSILTYPTLSICLHFLYNMITVISIMSLIIFPCNIP
eukprot:NODE_509_length_6670_cov_0.463856.p5 type:complete len:103 gc:universal NODE_509_length_6670_cov_0.463856:87-395(+)